jgi:hypothetical protein
MLDIITKNHITLFLAVVGSALGVINLWHQLKKDKLRVKVIPIFVVSYTAQNKIKQLGVEVINRSNYAVTIHEVGFFTRNVKRDGRMVIVSPITADGKPWPRRLEPRESVTACPNNNIFNEKDFKQIKKAYARTACGYTFYGTSKVLKNLVKK